MKTERFTFPGALGHDLAGRLDLPDDGNVIDYVVFAHGFTIGKDFKPLQTIAKALVDEGYGMLRFDFTGLGRSGGDFSDTNFSTNVEEIKAAAAYLEEHYDAPGLLVGHSFGGTAALKAAEDLPSVTAIATIGSPCSTTHIVHNFADKLEEIIESGQAEVMLAGRPFTIKNQFLDDLKKHPRISIVRAFRSQPPQRIKIRLRSGPSRNENSRSRYPHHLHRFLSQQPPQIKTRTKRTRSSPDMLWMPHRVFQSPCRSRVPRRTQIRTEDGRFPRRRTSPWYPPTMRSFRELRVKQ